MTEEYLKRIEAEEKVKQLIVDELHVQELAIEKYFEQFRVKMDAEMHECITYLRALESRVDQSTGQKAPWLLSPEAFDEWMLVVKNSTNERHNVYQALQRKKEETKRVSLAEGLRSLTLVDKLYELSLSRPRIWRAMKQREAEIQQYVIETDQFLRCFLRLIFICYRSEQSIHNQIDEGANPSPQLSTSIIRDTLHQGEHDLLNS